MNYYCTCFDTFTGVNCEFSGCTNPALSSNYINQTNLYSWKDVDLSPFNDSTFFFPSFITVDQLFIGDPDNFLWLSSTGDDTFYIMDSQENAIVYSQLTIARGIYRTARANTVQNANAIYIMANNCSSIVQPVVTACVMRYVLYVENPLGTLFVNNFTFIPFPFNNDTYTALTCNVDASNTVWITLQDITRGAPVFLTRWSADFSQFLGWQDLSLLIQVSKGTNVYFDGFNCRLFVQNTTDVYYYNVNCTSLAIPIGHFITNFVPTIVFHLQSWPLPAGATSATGIMSLDVSNSGTPWLMVKFQTAVATRPLVQWNHFSATDTILSSNTGIFTFPFLTNTTSMAIYSSTDGGLFVTDSAHLLERSCSYGTPACSPVCNPGIASCSYNTCACNNTLIGPYPSCGPWRASGPPNFLD